MAELRTVGGRDAVPPEHSIIGVYVRNSTLAQIGNAGSEWQMDLVPYLEGMGFGVQVYEEWGVSGTTLATRPKANSMLADLQAGCIHGIAVAELSRLARDERGLDTAFIGDQLKRYADGRLITYGRVFDLRRPYDWKLYQMLTMVAGWQCGDIRNTMYAGMVKSAERAPMFKGKVKVGYKRVVLVDTQARPVSVGGGRVRTTLEKDYSRA